MNRLLEILRKLPIARWIRPLWKGALKQATRLAFDYLRKEVREVEAAAPDKLKAAVRRFCDSLQARIRSSPLPEGIENKVCGMVAAEAVELYARIDSAGSSDIALHAVEEAIGQAENIVLGRIEAL